MRNDISRLFLSVCVPCMFCFAAFSARAGISISLQPTQNIVCSNGLCTSTVKSSVLNVHDLRRMLTSGDVTIKSNNLGMDIALNAGLTWNTPHRLTFEAYRSVKFFRPLEVAGKGGGLTITTNDGGTGGDYRFFDRGHVEFQFLSASLIINGTSFYLVKALKDIPALGYVALAESYDAGALKHYLPPQFSPNVFEGLGNTISNLQIHHPSSITSGLLRTVQVIRDLGLTNITVYGGGDPGNDGAFGAVLYGEIEYCYATGQIFSNGYGGGLVAEIVPGAIVKQSYSSVVVSGTNGYTIGGIASISQGLVNESYATGVVSGDGVAGGLVGDNQGGTLSNSYATGSVTSSEVAGGLVGVNEQGSKIAASYSTAEVRMNGSGSQVGGVIGDDLAGSGITSAYWDLDTSGIDDPSQGAGNISNDPGITGLTTAQFLSGLPQGFDPLIWGQRPKRNGGYPYLLDNLPN